MDLPAPRFQASQLWNYERINVGSCNHQVCSSFLGKSQDHKKEDKVWGKYASIRVHQNDSEGGGKHNQMSQGKIIGEQLYKSSLENFLSFYSPFYQTKVT